MTLISAQDLGFDPGSGPILRGVDFHIQPGEIVTIVGPNGSGKSTLLRLLLGVLPASTGQVSRKRRLRVGYVPQKLAIDTSLPMSVDRFLQLPGRHPQADRRRVMAEVGIEGLERRPLTALSGGQFQRALLARALLTRPEILVLDEPTQGLDQPGEAAFYRLIERVRAETGCAVLMVSHDLHVVMAASDRVICLNGHVCCEGTPHVVREAPEYRALFGQGTGGALALYQHEHNHTHDHTHEPGHDHDHTHEHGEACDHA